ncbi:MAG: SDR family oxidoreductase [Rubrivivax sp.]|nr:SDR family oxidoreductase [Rubrivivax sp.]
MTNAQRVVLVTGASTGIGRCIAGRLAAAGHRVYAGARKPADLQALDAMANVEALALDVGDPAQVAAAVQRIAADQGALHGLVNNAGIGGLGPLVSWTDAELQQLFDTNVFGPLRLARECLPLLLAGRGRIVHIGSQGGSITSRWYGPYTATKHALEALAQCQRDELAAHGIGVSIVQPGGVVSQVGANAMAGTAARFERTPPPFDAEARAVLQAWRDAPGYDPALPESAANRRLSPPDDVAVAVAHALFDPAPRLRYLVGTRWEGQRVLDNLLQRLLDANDGAAMQYTPAELHALLDRHLAARAAP